MRVDVRLYSILRHRPGGEITDRLSIEIPEGETIDDVKQLLSVPADLEIIVAVNGKVVFENIALRNEDLLALIPSVAGGSPSGQTVVRQGICGARFPTLLIRAG